MNERERKDTFCGIPRLWRGRSVYTGLVSVRGKRGYSYHEIRVEGKMVKHVAGLSRRTLDLAREVVEKAGL